MNWNLSDAKNRLSEVLDRAKREGPQRIQRRKEAFIVVGEAEYEKMTGRRASFKEWLLKGPSLEGVDVERDRSAMREIDL
jgi:prevent-host-death family protein